MTTPAHFRRLEEMYHAARCNVYYRPTLQVAHGQAMLRIPVREDFFHGADAVHGSVYFKALDDAAYFAANSLVTDAFLLTASFHLDFLRPVSRGALEARGRVVHASARRVVADATLVDDEGRELARGSGTFMPSHHRLDGRPPATG